MLVHKLCQKFCPDEIPELSTRLGDGADGEVFELTQDPNKVIKLCVSFNDSINQVERVLHHMINSPAPTHARVYEYVRLGCYRTEIVYWLYYYTMEKLQKISDDEKKVFHSIISHEDCNAEKNFSLIKVKKMLKGLSKGLDFDAERVIFFYDNCRKTQVAHLDIHVRNIMKDAAGNFKLIDFDRAQLLEKNNGKTE
jgi:hypothetical protein